MNITLITVGRIKEKYLQDAIAEYSKRLSKYCTLSIIECPDEPTKENASDTQIQTVLEKEGERILQKIPQDKDVYITALAINGKQYDSPALSDHMQDLMLRGNSHLVYIIGGSWGLSPAVLARANEKLSFSKLTFPHQLMRVILLEQIYRCFRIMKHEPYHK